MSLGRKQNENNRAEEHLTEGLNRENEKPKKKKKKKKQGRWEDGKQLQQESSLSWRTGSL